MAMTGLKSVEGKCDYFIISVKALKVDLMLRGSPYFNTSATLSDRIWYGGYTIFFVGLNLSVYIYADKFIRLILD